MKIRSWLSTCSSKSSTATSGDSTAPSPPGPLSPPPKSLTSDSSSDFQTNSSTSSLQSNLSLLTLPSLPSLQKLPLSLSSSSPTTTLLLPAHIHFLTLHHHLLYAASGHQIHIFSTSTPTPTPLHTFPTTPGSVKSISFNNGRAFTAHQDCHIRVWNVDETNHKLVATLPTLEDRLARLLLPRNYVTVRRHKKRLWVHHNDAVSGLAVSDNKNVTISVSWDRSIKIWNNSNFRCSESVDKAHDDAINAVVVSDDGVIYTGSADKRIKAWKKEGAKFKYGLLATLEKHKSAVNALALGENGSVLFSGSCDRSILVWEREDSANHMVAVGALRGHAKAILCLINVRDLLMSGSADRTVRIWRRGFDGRYCCLTVLEGHRTPVRTVAAAVEEKDGGGGVKVFSGSFDGEIRVWQVEVSSVKGNYDF